MTEDKFRDQMERHYKRNATKDKIIVAQGLVIMLLLVAGVMYATYQARVLKDQIALSASHTTVIKQELSDSQIQDIINRIPKGRDGANGINGANGSNGANGVNGVGIPGQSVTADQIATAVAEYMRLNPIQALVGPRGADGFTPPLDVDGLCRLVTTYSGDSYPTVLAQLPKPCDP